MNKYQLLKTNIPLIIGFIVAETIFYLERDGNVGSDIAIIVALITVAGTILANFFLYKKDSNRIGEVKADTSEIKPEIRNIHNYSKETNDCITKDMRYDLLAVLENTKTIQSGEMNKNINLLAEDLKFRRRLEESYKGSNTRETIVAGIDELYLDNAGMQEEILKLKQQNKEMAVMINSKNIQIKELKKENERLSKKMDKGMEI